MKTLRQLEASIEEFKFAREANDQSRIVYWSAEIAKLAGVLVAEAVWPISIELSPQVQEIKERRKVT